jgi:hypothetical protein
MRRMLFFAMMIMVMIAAGAAADPNDFSNILFLHHSTGANLIAQGGVRGLIAAYNTVHGTHLEFWDHGYNGDGLRDQDGNHYSNYEIPGDNTDPIGFYTLFTQPLHNPPDNAFSRVMLPHVVAGDTVTHDVFVYKSCFPASDISSDQMLEQYQTWYLAIRDIMDQHPEKIFIPLTPPPLTRSSTTAANAARAQQFADWLTSPEYLSGHPNVFVFNFRDYLMEHDPSSYYFNCLREAYGGAGGDSHPNQLANQTIAPYFVDFITTSILSYQDLQHNGTDNSHANTPTGISILNSFPNPFNSAVNIEYSLSSESNVSIDIFDITGKKVDSIAIGKSSAGEHRFTWHADNLSSGAYIYRVNAGNSSDYRKVLFIK